VIAFMITALAVLLIIAWFVAKKFTGKIPGKRERAYWGIRPPPVRNFTVAKLGRSMSFCYQVR
jgi:hypothetical protein